MENHNNETTNAQNIYLEFISNSRTSGSVIPEENPDEFWPASDIPDTDANQMSLPMQQSQLNSIAAITATTATVDINNRKMDSSRRGDSPAPISNNSYGNSPGNTNGYMLMSPGIDINRR